jgi:hypothetical protein
MKIDYDKLLESFSVASFVYNELGNGTLQSLPIEVFSKLDKAVSRAIIVGILAAKWDVKDLSTEQLDEITNTLFNKLLET